MQAQEPSAPTPGGFGVTGVALVGVVALSVWAGRDAIVGIWRDVGERSDVSSEPAIVASLADERRSVSEKARVLQAAQAKVEAQLAQQVAREAEARAAQQAQAEQAAARRRAEVAEQDRKRHEMIEKDRMDRAIKHARRRLAIEFYSTPWCGYCKRARAYMRGHEITFVEHDIDSDPAAKRRVLALNPRGSVPTFDIEGQTLVGFSSKRLEATIQRAAEAKVR